MIFVTFVQNKSKLQTVHRIQLMSFYHARLTQAAMFTCIPLFNIEIQFLGTNNGSVAKFVQTFISLMSQKTPHSGLFSGSLGVGCLVVACLEIPHRWKRCVMSVNDIM